MAADTFQVPPTVRLRRPPTGPEDEVVLKLLTTRSQKIELPAHVLFVRGTTAITYSAPEASTAAAVENATELAPAVEALAGA